MKIMVIDGNSIMNRAFYGVRLLSTREGLYTNAIYGFLSTYFKLFDEEKPDGVCVCFDLKAPTFRHMMFEDYKAGRHEMPGELQMQVPVLKKTLDLMGVPRFELEGYEADGIIGTFALHKSDEADVIIVTGDREELQLLKDNV